jgi:hypothetical protein
MAGRTIRLIFLKHHVGNIGSARGLQLSGNPRGGGFAAFGKTEPDQVGAELSGCVDDTGCVWAG